MLGRTRWITTSRDHVIVAEAYKMRGLAKDEFGDNQGAIKDYNKAIELCYN